MEFFEFTKFWKKIWNRELPRMLLSWFSQELGLYIFSLGPKGFSFNKESAQSISLTKNTSKFQ